MNHRGTYSVSFVVAFRSTDDWIASAIIFACATNRSSKKKQFDQRANALGSSLRRIVRYVRVTSFRSLKWVNREIMSADLQMLYFLSLVFSFRWGAILFPEHQRGRHFVHQRAEKHPSQSSSIQLLGETTRPAILEYVHRNLVVRVGLALDMASDIGEFAWLQSLLRLQFLHASPLSSLSSSDVRTFPSRR